MKGVILVLLIAIAYVPVDGQFIEPTEDRAPDSDPGTKDEAPDSNPQSLIQADEPPIFQSHFESSAEEETSGASQSGDYYDYESDEMLAVMDCPEITCASSFTERVASWLCDYTNYKIEAIMWKEQFEEWWYSCDESATTSSLWGSSFDCIDTSMVRCRNQDKLLCRNIGMECSVCVCTDGNYEDSTALYKLWRQETAMFRERFEIYKSNAQSCTQSVRTTPNDCPGTTPTPEPTDGPSGDYSGFGIDPSSGSGSGEESEDVVDVHM